MTLCPSQCIALGACIIGPFIPFFGDVKFDHLVKVAFTDIFLHQEGCYLREEEGNEESPEEE